MKMNNDIKVSVIIPNYNYGQYIEQCIYSVLQSDFKYDVLEIIVVDDVSTDNSIELIENIINNTKTTIRLIKHVINLGLAKTRNTGIENAHGKYLFFLDSDNYISNTCLRIHFDYLSKNNEYVACYAPIQKFDDSSGKMLTVFSNQVYDYNKLMYGNYIDAMAMITKDAFLELGFYDEDMPGSGWEDYELWLRIGKKGKKVYFIEGKPLTYYRIHKDSMIRSMPSDKLNILASYISEKYSLPASNKNEAKMHTKIQIFWGGAGGDFSEECSLIQFVELKDTITVVKFQLHNLNDHIDLIRFDLSDEIGVINIHGIIMRDEFGNTKWGWDKNTSTSQQNLFLVENKKQWPNKIVQVAVSIDPWFAVAVANAIKALYSSGFSIEIALSKPDQQQMNFLNGNTNLLSFINEKEYNELEQQVSNLAIEISNLQTGLNLTTQTLQGIEKENLLLNQNNSILHQFNQELNGNKIELNNDKILLSTILTINNDLISKATDKITKIEQQLIENVKKQIEDAAAHKITLAGYDENNQTKEDALNRIQQENMVQISALQQRIKIISLQETEQKIKALTYQEKFQLQEALVITFQNDIRIAEKKIIDLNNEVFAGEATLNELQLACGSKEEKNKQLINENNKLEEKIIGLSNLLKGNLTQKQELIESIKLQIAQIEQLSLEKKESNEKYNQLQNQFLSVKLNEQQLQVQLSEANKKNIENEAMIGKLCKDNTGLKNQKLIDFLKAKIKTSKAMD